MPTRLLLPSLLLLIFQLTISSVAAQSNDVPRLIYYQGQLMVNDQPATGTHDFSFTLYDQEEGGTTLWNEPLHQVTVENGVFSVMLGRTNPLEDEVFDAEELYLAVSYQEEEIDRLRLASTPYAIRASMADRASLAEEIEDGAVTASSLAPDAAVLSLNDLTGALTIDGTGAATVEQEDGAITIHVEESEAISFVSTDATLTGTGLPGDELSLAEDAAVRSLNELAGPLTLEGGGAVSVTEDGSTITIHVEESEAISFVSTDNTLMGTGLPDDELGLAPDAAVLSLNALAGSLTLEGEGAVSITEDGNTITVGVEEFDGITSVDTDGTTIEGDGVDTPLSIASQAISSSHLADGAVGADQLANNTAVRSLNDMTEGVDLVAGDNVSISRNQLAGTLEIAATVPDGGLTQVATAGPVIGDGTSQQDAVTIGTGLIDTEHLSDNAVTSPILEDGAVTAAKLDGAAAVLTLNDLAGTLTLEGSGAASVDEDGGTITIHVDESDGISSVATDATLTGTGVSGDELGLASNAAVLSLNALTGPLTLEGDGAATVTDDGNTITISVDEADGITSVDTDGTTIEGDGVDTPLSIASQAIGSAQLANNVAVRSLNNLTDTVELTEGDNISITTDGTSGSIEIAATVPDGGLTQVETSGPVIGDGTSQQDAVTIGTGLIDTEHLSDNAVTTPIIEDGAVTGAKLDGSAAVLSLNGLSGGITLDGTGAASVTEDGNTVTINVDETNGIEDVQAGSGLDRSVSGDVITLSIDPAGLGAEHIATNAISADELQANAVTETAIADGAVTADKIGLGAILSDRLADNAVTEDRIADGAVTTDKLDGSAAVLSLTADDSGTPEDLTGALTLAGAGTVEVTHAGQTITIEGTNNDLSSIRFKENVTSLENALALVQQLRGVRYTWIEDGSSDVGLIAEEVHEVIPEVVDYEDDGTTVRALNYGKLVSVLVEATKEQQAMIERQQEAIDEMEARVERLERLVEQAAANASTTTTER